MTWPWTKKQPVAQVARICDNCDFYQANQFERNIGRRPKVDQKLCLYVIKDAPGEFTIGGRVDKHRNGELEGLCETCGIEGRWFKQFKK